jgi:hypothetical protein
MTVRPLLFLALLTMSGGAAAAQTVGPPAPQITEKPRCEPSGDDDEEIVVCGERYDENSPYRIPRQFRDREPEIADRDASFAARQRDMNSVEQYSSQTIGSGGWTQQSRQRECEWRADRQRAQGRQPDCTRRVRPDEATDWQRGR